VNKKKKKDTYYEVEQQGTQDGIVMLININIISCPCVSLIMAKKKKEEEDDGLGICGDSSDIAYTRLFLIRVMIPM